MDCGQAAKARSRAQGQNNRIATISGDFNSFFLAAMWDDKEEPRRACSKNEFLLPWLEKLLREEVSIHHPHFGRVYMECKWWSALQSHPHWERRTNWIFATEWTDGQTSWTFRSGLGKIRRACVRADRTLVGLGASVKFACGIIIIANWKRSDGCNLANN